MVDTASDDAPGLEVGFAINTNGAFAELLRFAQMFDDKTVQFVRQAAKVEEALGGMVKLGPATAQITSFGNAATRELQSLTRERTRAEKAGEGMVLQLEREAATFGKTRAEIRAMKVEERALAAERTGNTELAARLREREAALFDAEFSANRRARQEVEALAEDKATAAQRAVAAAEQEAQALRTAKFAYDQFELAAKRGMGAYRADQHRIAAAAAEGEAQALRNARFAHDQFELAAKRGLATHRAEQQAIAAAAAETDRLAAAAVRLRASIDPAFAAQQRFDREMAEARVLANANLITFDEYIEKLRQEEMALNRGIDAKSRHNSASGQQRMATQQLGFQLNDIATQYASGTAASMIFAQQSGQVIQALQLMTSSGSGVLAWLASWQGAVVAAIAIAAIPFVAKLVEGNNELEKAVEKLKQDAAQTEITRQAKERFAQSADGVSAAIRAQRDALDETIKSERTSAEQALASAQANYANEVSIRKVTASLLRKARAEQDITASAGGQAIAGEAGGIANSIMAKNVAELDRQLRVNTEDLAKAEANLADTRVALMTETAKRLIDPAAMIQRMYDQQVRGAENAARASGDYARGQSEVSRIERERAESVRLLQESQSAATRTAQEYGRAVSSSQAKVIAQAAGLQVNSADRTFASQKALYDRWVAAGRPANNPVAKPGSSAHEFGNALDIQKTAGATVQRIRDAFAAEGVRLTKVFSEQGHWHVEWARSAEDVRAVGDANRDAAAATRELEKAQKEVFAWASKSADVMLTPDTGEAMLRRFAESQRSFKAIMGDADPVGDAADALADSWKENWEQQGRDRIEQQQLLNDHLRLTADLAGAAGNALANAFGKAGGAIGDVIAILGQYGAEQERIEQSQLSASDKARASSALQMDSLIGLTGAAKRMFAEQSAGYRALEAAEKAMAIIRAVQIARDVAAGAARMFASLGPAAFPAIAAMVAVMAGLGVSGAFSSSKPPPPSNTGTGTVLGDRSASSASIKNAIDELRQVDTLMLSSSREMAASLKSIDSQIGGFAAQILKAGDINASAGVQTGFKTDTTGKVLSSLVDPLGIMSKIPIIGGVFSAVKSLIGSLFGSKTQITGSGLYGGAQSLGGVLQGGFDASYYSDVKKTKKFLGITTGTSYSTQYSGADPTLENQFTLILRSFNDAIAAAAGPLGESTTAIQQRLNGFIVDIGKIDLTGLSGEQITEKLTAVFGAAADRMATSAFPGIERFQKAGEGAFETLVRVASTVEATTAALTQLGTSTRNLSIDAKLGLAGQFDSLSALSSAVDGYFKGFYTKEEQAAAKAAQFAEVFSSLGVAAPSTLAAFRQLVEAQDLTTAAGQATYATLLQLAPAFADLQASMEGAKSAADIASERQDLQRQLLELAGDTAGIRALDLAKLDASNRGLQEQIYAIQDAQKAAAAADELRKAWTSVGDSIADEVKRIRGLAGGGDSSFAALQGQFNAATIAARGGDQDAAKNLPQLSQAMLTAAALVATSRQELDRVQAATAASLEATKRAIDAIAANPSASANNTAALVAAAAASQAASTPAAANDGMAEELRALREEVAGMRKDNNAGHAANASNTGGIKRKLDDVTGSGGDAIDVRQAA